MPFRAQCVFCGYEVLAPDHANGGSACCPKCSSFFTLVPAAKVRVNGLAREPAGVHTTATQAPAAASVVAPQYPLERKQASEGGPRAETGLQPKPRLVNPVKGYAPPRPRSVEPFGLAALLLGGAALLCASGPRMCPLVLPISGFGALVGLTGLLLSLGQGRIHVLFPVSGTAVAGLVLLTALLFPKFLGPVFLASRARETIDPALIRAVPFPGKLGNIEPAPDWVDAGKAALQQGRVNVQVISASVRRVQAKSTPSKKIPPGNYHFIRLRVQQDAASASAAKRAHAPGSRLEKAAPRLTDNTGKVYPLCDVVEMAPAPNERRSSVFPAGFQDQLLVFEASATRPENLRLEVPAEAWGGKGALRFSIPASMIKDERTGSADLTGGR